MYFRLFYSVQLLSHFTTFFYVSQAKALFPQYCQIAQQAKKLFRFLFRRLVLRIFHGRHASDCAILASLACFPHDVILSHSEVQHLFVFSMEALLTGYLRGQSSATPDLASISSTLSPIISSQILSEPSAGGTALVVHSSSLPLSSSSSNCSMSLVLLSSIIVKISSTLNFFCHLKIPKSYKQITLTFKSQWAPDNHGYILQSTLSKEIISIIIE